MLVLFCAVKNKIVKVKLFVPCIFSALLNRKITNRYQLSFWYAILNFLRRRNHFCFNNQLEWNWKNHQKFSWKAAKCSVLKNVSETFWIYECVENKRKNGKFSLNREDEKSFRSYSCVCSLKHWCLAILILFTTPLSFSMEIFPDSYEENFLSVLTQQVFFKRHWLMSVPMCSIFFCTICFVYLSIEK